MGHGERHRATVVAGSFYVPGFMGQKGPRDHVGQMNPFQHFSVVMVVADGSGQDAVQAVAVQQGVDGRGLGHAPGEDFHPDGAVVQR